MFALLYASEDVFGFDAPALSDLCSTSAQKNRSLQVTGYLFYRSGRFLQYLEGEKEAVMSLMATIRKDERHTIAIELEHANANQRLFPHWSMQYVNPDGIMFEDVIAIQLNVLKAAGPDSTLCDKVWSSVAKLTQYRNARV